MSNGNIASSQINWDSLDKTRYFGIGSVLFFLVRVIVFPASLVKTRLQLESTASTSAIRTVLSIIRNEGGKSLYKGFPMSAAGAVPAQMVYLSVYESMKQYVGGRVHGEMSVNLIAGMCASTASQVIVVPVFITVHLFLIRNRSTLYLKNK
jgi:solute carrier family 25 protein 44